MQSLFSPSLASCASGAPFAAVAEGVSKASSQGQTPQQVVAAQSRLPNLEDLRPEQRTYEVCLRKIWNNPLQFEYLEWGHACNSDQLAELAAISVPFEPDLLYHLPPGLFRSDVEQICYRAVARGGYGVIGKVPENFRKGKVLDAAFVAARTPAAAEFVREHSDGDELARSNEHRYAYVPAPNPGAIGKSRQSGMQVAPLVEWDGENWIKFDA